MAEKTDPSTEIEHISRHHLHPLTLIDTAKDGGIRCDGCLSPINGPGFGCPTCSFFLHDGCTKLPMELPQHPLHPKGVLQLHLIELKFEDENQLLWCKLCKHYIVDGFVYKCIDEGCRSGCFRVGDFLMHSKCALKEPSIEFPNHRHKLISIKEFYCRASCVLCGLELQYRKDGVDLYRCLECDIRIHVSCFSRFPSTIDNLDIHPDTLDLYLDPLSENFEEYSTRCNVCKKERDISEGFYACSQCHFTWHVHCADSTAQVEEERSEDSGPSTLKHCFHFCPLVFYSSIVQESLRCSGCQSLFANDPGYGCEACGFFLHENCAKLPQTLRHLLHHNPPLTLERIGELYSPPQTGDYMCELCHLPIDKRFFYECKSNCGSCLSNGKFRIHINCAVLKASTRHPGHEHSLVFIKEGFSPKICVACGIQILFDKDGFYRCFNCNFRIHKGCLDLPHEDGRTDDRSHPLTLYYNPLPEDYDEGDYYCDWCDGKRDVHTFSYVCKECNYISHTRCDDLKKFLLQYSEMSTRNDLVEIEKPFFKNPSKREPLQHSPSIDEGLLNIKPLVLKFLFELKKQISCFLLLENKSSHRVAFKFKVTKPRKYFVRPNNGIISPYQKCKVTVFMNPQDTAPQDMQSKDKFLVQAIVVPQGLVQEYITEEMFHKEEGRFIEETLLRVIYVSPNQ